MIEIIEYINNRGFLNNQIDTINLDSKGNLEKAITKVH